MGKTQFSTVWVVQAFFQLIFSFLQGYILWPFPRSLLKFWKNREELRGKKKKEDKKRKEEKGKERGEREEKGE